jgi:AcrR family transcriptional regulator
MTKANNRDLTKERLLDEAEALFAKNGYDAVSVREITHAARCNLAAVNYHFGNKKNLYLEVFRARWIPRAKRLHDCFRKSLDAEEEAATPRAIVHALAEAFLAGPMSDEERFRHSQLMVRELGRSTEALELVAEEIMHPFFKSLADMLYPSMPDKVGKERLMLDILSMFGVVLYFNFARAAVTRITGREYTKAFEARLVEQIAEFSLKGLGVEEHLR